VTADDDGVNVPFEVAAARWQWWRGTAHDFILWANYLIDWIAPPNLGDSKSAHGGPSAMLVLFAVAAENLLKAIRVAKHGSPVVDDGGKKRLRNDFPNHDLIGHLRAVDLKLSKGDEALLKRMTHVLLAGKYHVPKVEGGTPGAWRFDYPDGVAEVWTLLERLDAELRRVAGSPNVPPRRDFRTRYRPPGYELKNE